MAYGKWQKLSSVNLMTSTALDVGKPTTDRSHISNKSFHVTVAETVLLLIVSVVLRIPNYINRVIIAHIVEVQMLVLIPKSFSELSALTHGII